MEEEKLKNMTKRVEEKDLLIQIHSRVKLRNS